jgi:hypothetical protein
MFSQRFCDGRHQRWCLRHWELHSWRLDVDAAALGNAHDQPRMPGHWRNKLYGLFAVALRQPRHIYDHSKSGFALAIPRRQQAFRIPPVEARTKHHRDLSVGFDRQPIGTHSQIASGTRYHDNSTSIAPYCDTLSQLRNTRIEEQESCYRSQKLPTAMDSNGVDFSTFLDRYDQATTVSVPIT